MTEHEMKHADALMERLFTLDALPNLQDLGKLLLGETLIEALGCDLQSEQGAQATLKVGIAQAELSRDYGSRDLLQRMLEDTEEHIDFLETQLDLVGKVGEQNDLQTQLGSRDLRTDGRRGRTSGTADPPSSWGGRRVHGLRRRNIQHRSNCCNCALCH